MQNGNYMSALNWATIAMSVVAIALSIDTIRISRKNHRHKPDAIRHSRKGRK